MRGKYITLNIRMACTKKRTVPKKSILEQIEATITERKRILQEIEKYTQTAQTVQMILSGKQAA